MKIGGLTKLSLSDYPGHTTAVIFTQGCNFRCPFCHNGRLLTMDPPPDELTSERWVLEFLEERSGFLDAVTISGGEPTLQHDLADFIREVRRFGYKIKLDTNGSRPDVVQTLLVDGLVDFIAMDLKAPWQKYDRLTGVRPPIDLISKTMSLITRSATQHMFRLTFVPQLLTSDDIDEVRRLVPAGSVFKVQPFVPKNALDVRLRELETSSDELN